MGAPIQLLGLKEKDKVLKILQSWALPEREARGLFQTESDFEAALQQNEVWGLSNPDGVLAGILWAKFSGKVVEIQCLLVNRAFAGVGEGTALLEGFFAFARARNIEEIWLEVSKDNVEAVQFYKKRGFESTGVRKNYYRNGADAINMSKPLHGFHLA